MESIQEVIIIVSSMDSRTGGPPKSIQGICKALKEELGIVPITYTKNRGDCHDSEFMVIKEVSFLACMWLLISKWRNKSTIVHIQGLWEPIVLFSMLTMAVMKINYTVTPRGMLQMWSLEQRRLIKNFLSILQRPLLNLSNSVIVSSNIEKEDVIAYGVKACKVEIAGNLVETQKGLRVNSDDFTQILFMSRIHKKKGLELLMSVWRDSFANRTDCKLILCGVGEEEYTNQLVRCVEQIKNVEYLGHVGGKNKWDLIASSDLMVLPSYSENFGNIVLESLSNGTPVLTTPYTPWSSISELNCGYIVDTNEQEIKEALLAFLNLDSDLAIVKRNNALNYYNHISNESVLPILKNYAGTSRFK